MHELSLVAQLVRRCGEVAAGRPVRDVYVHCAEGTGTDEVAEAFAFLASRGGPAGDAGVMQAARLQLTTVPARGTCRCGFSGELRPETLAGHMFLCPECGCVGEQGPALELVGLTFTGT
jgi:Zn finger protein HypA/HybF involved in hydrogenase expression